MNEDKTEKKRSSQINGNIGYNEGTIKGDDIKDYSIRDNSVKYSSDINTEIHSHEETKIKETKNSTMLLVTFVVAIVVIIGMLFLFLYKTNVISLSQQQRQPVIVPQEKITQNAIVTDLKPRTKKVKPAPASVESQIKKKNINSVNNDPILNHSIAASSKAKTKARETKQPSTHVQKLDQKAMVLCIDTKQLPEGTNSRSKILKLKNSISKHGWKVKYGDNIDVGSDPSEAKVISRKYGTRYVLTGLLKMRDGSNSGSIVPGTSIQYAHCRGELFLMDTLSGDIRSIYESSKKGAGNSLVQAKENAAALLLNDMIQVVGDAI